MTQRIPQLYIAPSNIHDRGVFTLAAIPKGSIIEICPVLLIPPEDMEILKQTSLYDYYWAWEEDEQSGAIALGYGSIYNHSYTPNSRYLADFSGLKLEIHTIKDIEAGEEITFNYNGEPDDQTKVWFDDNE